MSFLLSGVAATAFSFWSKDSFSWPTWPPSDSWSSCLCLLVLIGPWSRLFKPKESAGRETTTKALSSLLVLALRRAVDSFLLCRAPSAASASRRDRSAALSRTSLRFPCTSCPCPFEFEMWGTGGEEYKSRVGRNGKLARGKRRGKIPNVSSREPETENEKKKNKNSCFVGGRGNDDSGGCGLQSGETDEARPGPSRDLRPSS